MQGERIVASETRILTSATLPWFMHSALREEDGLFGLTKKLMLHWVTVFAFQFWEREMSWVVSASMPIHSRYWASAQLTHPMAGWQTSEGIYKAMA
jgi:hypothetical protein